VRQPWSRFAAESEKDVMSTPPFAPDRVTTGIPGLDDVLGGGLVKAGLYLVEGRTGAGKTIMAAQIAAHRARLGERVLYVTLLGEFHGKLIEHFRTMDFFDETSFFGETFLLNGYEALTSGGAPGLLQFLAAAAREHRPSLLILDGFGTMHEHTSLPLAISQFVHELNTLVTTMGCTAILLGPARGTESRAEMAMADGLIELDVHSRGMRRGRTLEVHKLRASSHLHGRHTFTIGNSGLRVYPRLEAVMTAKDVKLPASSERIEIGIDGLDDMVGGGLIQGSSTRVLGAPGVGKTLLCLQFLTAGARTNESGLYFGFYESPDRLLLKAAAVGLQIARPVTDGRIRVLWQPPLEQSQDELGDRLLSTVREQGIRRVVIDGIEGFRDAALMPERFPLFAVALTTELRALGVTTVFTEEMEFFAESFGTTSFGVSALVENLIVLNYAEIGTEMRRLISVMKLRESDFDPGIRELIISNRGLRVGGKFPGVEHVMTGKARISRRTSGRRSGSGRRK
jgi:circadian clock protein KaiC